jgi:hypothetical protein
MLGLFALVEANGKVSAAERKDLIAICDPASGFSMTDDVRDLARDVVGWNRANRHYQGHWLGNLKAGDSIAKLEKLVDKWFYGQDLPARDKFSHYAPISGSLFVNGPTYGDISQGASGDCYLMVSLAELAVQDPVAIENMFIDNGDGTYTVRYYVDAQPYNTAYQAVATYITVDSMLPASGYADYSTELWVALAEKGYAQLKTLSGYGNDYGTIQGGFPVAAMNQFTGRAIIPSTLDLSLFTTDLSTGKMTCFGIGTHAYAVLNYDSASQVVTLYDPYGSVTTITWTELVNDGATLQCVL